MMKIQQQPHQLNHHGMGLHNTFTCGRRTNPRCSPNTITQQTHALTIRYTCTASETHGMRNTHTALDIRAQHTHTASEVRTQHRTHLAPETRTQHAHTHALETGGNNDRSQGCQAEHCIVTVRVKSQNGLSCSK